jgi:hypothetical protein
MSRTVAKPIFDSEPVEIAVSNPLPECKPMDIIVDDSDDDDSSIEVLSLNMDRPMFPDQAAAWEYIESFGVKDLSQRRNRYNCSTESVDAWSADMNRLTPTNKQTFINYYRVLFQDLERVFTEKEVWSKLARTLNTTGQQSLIMHIVIRGKTFYNSILDDPLFAGYLVNANIGLDEFKTFSNVVPL